MGLVKASPKYMCLSRPSSQLIETLTLISFMILLSFKIADKNLNVVLPPKDKEITFHRCSTELALVFGSALDVDLVLSENPSHSSRMD